MLGWQVSICIACGAADDFPIPTGIGLQRGIDLPNFEILSLRGHWKFLQSRRRSQRTALTGESLLEKPHASKHFRLLSGSQRGACMQVPRFSEGQGCP